MTLHITASPGPARDGTYPCGRASKPIPFFPIHLEMSFEGDPVWKTSAFHLVEPHTPCVPLPLLVLLALEEHHRPQWRVQPGWSCCCAGEGMLWGGMQSKPVLGRELHPAHGGLWSLADGTSPGWWLEA